MDGATDSAISFLRSPAAVRERCAAVLEHVRAGRSPHFSLNLAALERAADVTLEVMRRAYPGLQNIPVHSRVNHFKVGGLNRLERFDAISEPRERARTLTELIVTSVLLDAGAGAEWRFVEPETGYVASRSEGLALASYHCFCGGAFSSRPSEPLRADADGLAAVTPELLGRAFQVDAEHPLVGLEGRAALLRKLGASVRANPSAFGEQPRVGGLCDVLVARARDGQLPASELLLLVLTALGPIWPPRTQCLGVELGDAWRHPGAAGEGPSRGIVPLHKLSQWLSYSLLHPLALAGVTVSDVDGLTGLGEYRNGGLFIDSGVLVPRRAEAWTELHEPSSELVIEWRASTVALLDRLALSLRQRLNLDARSLSLGQVLEGGTWAAGRQLAMERRQGAPPLRIRSDGTLF